MWFEAARTGDLDTLQICLFWGQRVDQLSLDGNTALGLAAAGGHAAAVALLLERKADPNLHGPAGTRPLTAAVAGEHWDIATALVRAGADANADGVASIVAADPPKRELLALMFRCGLDPHGAHPDFGPYILFALNDPACVDMFFHAGFDLVRYEREAGESLLERALSAGISRFLHLLSRGANIDLPVDRITGRTMLMTLTAEGAGNDTQRLIRLLVHRGADLDRRDAAGLTARDYARARGDRSIITLLGQLRSARTRREKAKARRQAAAQAKPARRQRRTRQTLNGKKPGAKKVTTRTGQSSIDHGNGQSAGPVSLSARRASAPTRGMTAEPAERPKWTPECSGAFARGDHEHLLPDRPGTDRAT